MGAENKTTSSGNYCWKYLRDCHICGSYPRVFVELALDWACARDEQTKATCQNALGLAQSAWSVSNSRCSWSRSRLVYYTTGESDRRENKDNQREAALQAYIDKMSELLLHENLRNSSQDGEVRRIATLQTLTTLPRLDGKRKGSVLLFLYEAGLIENPNPIIMFGAAGLHSADLQRCDLSNIPGVSLHGSFFSYAALNEADFTGMHLRKVLFEGCNLRKARLIGADLRESELYSVNLSEVDLAGADLTDASLAAVDLTGAIVTNEQLSKAKLLQDIIMPDGSKRS